MNQHDALQGGGAAARRRLEALCKCQVPGAAAAHEAAGEATIHVGSLPVLACVTAVDGQQVSHRKH